LHKAEAYLPTVVFTLTLKDLKSAASALRDRLSARFRSRAISVRPLSHEWRQRHERDSVKH
jgi:hypothetical protein